MIHSFILCHLFILSKVSPIQWYLSGAFYLGEAGSGRQGSLVSPKLSVMGEATSQKVPCPFMVKDLLKQPASDNPIENPLLGLFSL